MNKSGTTSFDLSVSRNLEVYGCPSKENLSEQSVLLMNAMYIVVPNCFSLGNL